MSDHDAMTRRDLYRYVTADCAPDYIAIMRTFATTLLTDLSAEEVHAALGRSDLSVEDVENRCRQLVDWGNIIPALRHSRAATVNEWLRSRSRYHVTRLGGVVVRQLEEVLVAGDTAREVARELLAVTVSRLEAILDAVTGPTAPDEEALAGDVTIVFNNQRLFTESVTDFYAYVHSRISRYDLGGSDYADFKDMLLTYIDLITSDVARHAPAVAARLQALEAHIPSVVACLDRYVGPGAEAFERGPGRDTEDWHELTAWYTGSRGPSGPDQLRGAAERALGQLLANAKRMVSVSGTGLSRRGDLLKLAAWFNTADSAQAHRLYDNAFGAYPTRHLLVGPDEESGRDGPTTSWWDADPVDVPVSLRERGDRASRGRTAPVPDSGLDREAVLADARAELAAQQAAAAELAEAINLDGARVSPAARTLLLEHLAALLASSPTDPHNARPLLSTDSNLGLTVTAVRTPGSATVVHSHDGDLTIHGWSVHARPAQDAARTGTDE